MQVFTCTEFPGHWPVGVAAVIVAENVHDARKLLTAELRKAGFTGTLEIGEVKQLDTTTASATILNDGEY